MKYKLFAAVFFAALMVLPAIAFAQSEYICSVYFTGVGCPHCARSDPVVLGELTDEHDNLVVIEYEIYQQQVNGQFLYLYNQEYGTGLGVPLLIFGEDEHSAGDYPILTSVEESIASKKDTGNPCLLLDGTRGFGEMDISSIPGLPKIWTNGRILMKTGSGTVPSDTLRGLLFADDPSEVARQAREDGVTVESQDAVSVPLSGSHITFEQAIKLNNAWIFQCRGCPEIANITEIINRTAGDNETGKTGGTGGFIIPTEDSGTLVLVFMFLFILLAVFYAVKKGREKICLSLPSRQ